MRNCLTVLLALLVFGGHAVQADGLPTIEWHNWKFFSTEPLDLEEKNANNVINNRVAFPMTNLLDGDPATTWVWHDGNRKYGEDPRQFALEANRPFAVDELWLMNGYNRRRDLFLRNDRVVEIRISRGLKVIKTVNLKDEMGWRKISLPRRTATDLTIELIGIRKGNGPDNDICLSEMALFDRGRKIDLRMPQAVIYRLSACCGGTGYLMTRAGRVLGEGGFLDEQDFAWSPNGHYVAGIGETDSTRQLWVADLEKSRIIQRHSLSKAAEGFALKWKNRRTIEVVSDIWSDKKAIHRRTVRIPAA